LTRPTFGEAFRFWLLLGFISFGGPTGQIAIMHQELVEKRRWISDARFLHALNFCMLLPGPEATQLAIYVGWLLHRTWGGIVAGVLFVLPSAVLLWGLSCVYVLFGSVPWLTAVFHGLKPAVVAIVAAAVIRLSRRTLRNEVMWGLAAAAFTAIYFFKIPFPLIVLSAGIAGWIGGRFWRGKFTIPTGHGSAQDSISDSIGLVAPVQPTWQRSLRVCALSLTLWWTPVLLCGGVLGWNHALTREGIFFSKAALVTFGGAYAVLPYVARHAVEFHQWLNAGQMLDGLALAETTPGPLIMVLQFVGFLGGWNHPGALRPLLAASAGAAMTTWTTFVPCFLWIFLGAPYVERLRNHVTFSTALAAVTAAVVGVVGNLAVWMAMHVLFPAASATATGLLHQTDWFALALAVVAFVGMVKWRWGIIPVVLAAGAAGWFFGQMGG
jgi:chromate transporter